MIWIFALALLLFVVPWPGFRKIGLAIAGTVILIIVALILFNDRSKKVLPPPTDATLAPAARQKMMDHDEYVIRTQDKSDPDAAHRIALHEVRFGEITPVGDAALAGDPAYSNTRFRSIQARLYNDSARYTLTNYSYDLTIQDCIAERCTTVFEQRHQGAPISIPPAQARDILIPLQTTAATDSLPFKLLGTARVQLNCTDTRAYQTPDGVQPRTASP